MGTTGPTGKLSPFGRTVTINKKEITREQRAADGTLKQDCIVTKREFVLNYADITESALDTFDYWYSQYVSTETPLTLYMYYSDVGYDEYTVVPYPIDRTRVIKAADNLYSGVKFLMVEV